MGEAPGAVQSLRPREVMSAAFPWLSGTRKAQAQPKNTLLAAVHCDCKDSLMSYGGLYQASQP